MKRIIAGSGVPQSACLLRVPRAVLVEAHYEWQVNGRRYLSEGSMVTLTNPTDPQAVRNAGPMQSLQMIL
jgi:hypothetical protein